MDEILVEFDSLPSTNDYLKQHWDHLAPFAFVRAKEQTAGKGRGERHWIASKGENLTFSLLLKDPALWKHIGLLSLSAAVAVGKTLERFGLDSVTIKWPNDVLIHDKKVCGILLEGSLPSYCVIGIGVNVNQTLFNGDYRREPTSIALEKGSKIDGEAFYAFLRNELRQNIFRGLEGPSLLSYLHSHDALKGKSTKTWIEGKEEEVLVLGYDEEYRLLVSYQGKTLALHSGEVF